MILGLAPLLLKRWLRNIIHNLEMDFKRCKVTQVY